MSLSGIVCDLVGCVVLCCAVPVPKLAPSAAGAQHVQQASKQGLAASNAERAAESRIDRATLIANRCLLPADPAAGAGQGHRLGAAAHA